MTPELKTKWLEALRSGNYKQGQNRLRHKDETFCCLGVLCDVVDPSKWLSIRGDESYLYGDSRGFLTFSLLQEVDMTDSQQRKLAGLNDEGTTFSEIADHIEKNF